MDGPKAPRLQRSPDKGALFRDHFLFKALAPQHIDQLASCIVTRTVKRGATIFAKGDRASSMFAISKGSVKISVPSADGHEVVFNLLHDGDIFGEIAFLDGKCRTADAIAASYCVLFVIQRRDFLPILRSDPDVALKLIEVLCARLRHTTEQAENLMFRSLASRLAAALLQLAESGAGERNPKVAVTQRDLGSLIGISREGTNKQLRSWEANNWVRLERGGILIKSFETLSSIAVRDRL